MIQKLMVGSLALGLLSGGSVQARAMVDDEQGLIVIQTWGKSSAPVETINLSGKIEALFQDKSSTARSAVAKISIELKKVLSEYSDKDNKSLRIQGGFAVPHEETEYVDRGVKLKYPGLWQSKVDFSLTLPYSEENHDKIGEIQNRILELTANQPKEDGAATLRLRMDAPKEGVSAKTRQILEGEALNSSIAKAKQEMEQIAKQFGKNPQDIKLVRVQPIGSHSAPLYKSSNRSLGAAESSFDGPSGPGAPPDIDSIPYSFGEYSVPAGREYIFSFDP